MPRFPYLNADNVSDEGRRLLEATGDSNLWRTFLHHEELAHPLFALGVWLLREGSLDASHREIAILTIGRLRNSNYELHHHSTIAKLIGVPDEKVAAVIAGNRACLNDVESLVVDFVEEVNSEHGVSDRTFKALSSHYLPKQLIELTVVCGYYIMAANFLRTFGVEIEAHTKPIPNRETIIQAARAKELR